MKEISLRSAIFEGVHKFRAPPSFAKLNTGRLHNDFSMLPGYSGAMALVGDDGNYELAKFSIPHVQIPDLTLDQLWDCAKDHYGLTAAAAVSGIAGMPIPKSALGRGQFLGAGKNTNLISHYGLKFFPFAKVPVSANRAAKAAFGTTRVFGIIGRASPFVALGFAVFDVVSIGMCAIESKNGK